MVVGIAGGRDIKTFTGKRVFVPEYRSVQKRSYEVMAKMEIEKKKCITPEFRVSFPAVFKPKAFENQEAKYSLVMLFDSDTDLKPLKRAAMNAIVEKWGADKAKWPKNLRMPFRDGDEKEFEGYKGKTFVSASSKTRPGLVDAKVQPIITEEQFYAGCWARAEVIAFAYDTMGNKGVSFSLQNIQKLRDDTAFSGKRKAEDVFDAVDDGSDDEENYGAFGTDDLGESAFQ